MQTHQRSEQRQRYTQQRSGATGQSLAPEAADLKMLLKQQAQRYGSRPLYSFLGRDLGVTASISYQQLYTQAAAMAQALRAKDLAGRVALLLYPSGPEFPVMFWAAILADACPAPVARPRGRDWAVIRRINEGSGAAVLIGPESMLKRVPAELLAHVSVIAHEDIVNGVPDEWRSCDTSFSVDSGVGAGLPALLQYTSGSTGQPKGVALTHSNLLANLQRIDRAFACTDQDIGLCWLPLHHDMGLIGHVLQPVFSGIHNYFMSPAHFLGRALRWLEAISHVRATISGGPCFAYALSVQGAPDLYEHLDLSSWRVAYCGAERISAEVLQSFCRRLQSVGMRAAALFPCYGLAESSLFVTGRHGLKLTRDQQSSGRGTGELVSVGPVDNGIRIVKPETGRPCAEPEAGEVWLSSASVASGYYRDVRGSADVFGQQLGAVNGRFLRTGDLGMVVDGELYLLGRLKNVIKLRGSPLYAEDVEQLILDHGRSNGVTRCAALGFDHAGAEALAVLIEVERGFDPSRLGILKRDLWRLVAEQTGVVPERVVFVDPGSLPLTTSGKVQRFACYQLLTCMQEGE